MKISITTVCIILFVLVVLFWGSVFIFIPSENRPYICCFFILLAIVNSAFTSVYQRKHTNDVANTAKDIGFEIPIGQPLV